jgi:hypothetical protein
MVLNAGVAATTFVSVFSLCFLISDFDPWLCLLDPKILEMAQRLDWLYEAAHIIRYASGSGAKAIDGGQGWANNSSRSIPNWKRRR